MAAAAPLAVMSHPHGSSFFDDSQARPSVLRPKSTSRGSSEPRQSLRRSRSSLENLQKKKAQQQQQQQQQSRSSQDRLKPKGGQQFRVGNVTSNGRLQLRPVTRDFQPHASPPITPPYAQATRGADVELPDDWRGSVFTGSIASDLDALHRPARPGAAQQALDTSADAPAAPSRARSHSFSTIDDPVEPDRRTASNVKVLVNGASPKRTRTATPGSLDLLDISIPHWRLGTPHFSGKGSAILQSSIHTGSSTDGLRSSTLSNREYDRIFPQPPSAFYRYPVNQRTYSSRPRYLSVDGAASQRRTISSDIVPSPISQGPGAESTILLELEASPLNQNYRSLVRLSRASGQLLAATPSGLIAQITSPNLLDYELLSDFFLTFRSYLTTHQLVGFLITRLQWAVSRSDDFGRIVRVRTFVALRHWILNYFVDDFASDYSLRSELCNLVNDLCYELKARHDGGGGDLKILGELKKCWRRTCGLYWDVLEHKSDNAIDAILPGGRLGSRDSPLGAKQTPADVSGPLESAENPNTTDSTTANAIGPNSASNGSWFDAPTASHEKPADLRQASQSQANPASTPHAQNRVSDQSAHVVSCSITFKSSVNGGRKGEPLAGARPAPASAVSAPTSSRLSPNLRKNAPQFHSRGSSFADALRDNRITPLDTITRQQGMTGETLHPMSGSLVRGVLLPPTSPYVEQIVPESPMDEKLRNETIKTGQGETNNLDNRPYATSSPGMKKFLGNFRRALSTKQNQSQTSIADRKAASTKSSPRLSGIPITRSASHGGPGAPKRKLVDGHLQPRVDLLAVAASESFFKAAGEESEVPEPQVSANRNVQAEPMDRITSPQAQHLSAPPESNRMVSDVTMGSRSIFIVDDTGDFTAMTPRPVTHGSRAPNNSWIGGSRSGEGDENRETIEIGVEPKSPMANRLLELGLAGIVTPPSSSEFDLPESNVDREMADYASEIPETEPEPEPKPAVSRTSVPVIEAMAERESRHQEPEVVVEPAEAAETTQTKIANSLHVDRQPQLRRRPGGDLRAVDHVHSLDEAISQRSFRSSTSSSQMPLGSTRGLDASEQPKTAVDGKSAAEPPKKISIMDTHSSQPMLRASFEKEIAKLAKLPDDEDDGGIESTLRKLEGDLQMSDSPPFQGPMTFLGDQHTSRNVANPSRVAGSGTSPEANARSHREEEIFANPVVDGPTEEDGTQAAGREDALRVLEANGQEADASSAASFVESNRSDSSTPLLERGVSYGVREQRRSSSDWLKVSLPKSPTRTPPMETVSSLNLDSQPGKEPPEDSIGNEEQASGQNNNDDPSNTHKSFLLDDNQSLSGIPQGDSSAKRGVSSAAKSMGSFFDDKDDTMSLNHDGDVLPHPLRHPATPPRGKASPLIPQQFATNPGPSLAGHITQQDRDAFSSRSSQLRKAHPTSSTLELEKLPSRPTLSAFPGGAHMPFILGHDSLLLAQQFTLVEKDALSEIDWRQLIDLQWNTNAKTCPTWADCLKPSRTSNNGQRLMGGVDICITRFNIVVKWATSEIVLCQEMADRVACIVKYIHIARHARQLRNWATMFQLTMALVSGDVARLKETWQEVPESEREYLKELERLIMPTRNFHSLREEIEMAVAGPPAPGTDGGCIPFIGIYTHDLIYNSQKPAFTQQLQGLDSAERLINFERHRTAATIVKTLLRLVDASTKYPFQPVPDVLSRCLWMATLPDAEISQRSKLLEP